TSGTSGAGDSREWTRFHSSFHSAASRTTCSLALASGLLVPLHFFWISSLAGGGPTTGAENGNAGAVPGPTQSQMISSLHTVVPDQISSSTEQFVGPWFFDDQLWPPLVLVRIPTSVPR